MKGDLVAALVLGAGVVVAGIPVVFPNVPHGATTWIGLAAVYLLAWVLVASNQYVRNKASLGFRPALGVAVVVAVIPVLLRGWDVAAARPDLSMLDLTFVLWQLHVLVPFVVAFMLPLGAARERDERLGALAAVVLPFLLAAIWGSMQGTGFGEWFAVMYYGSLLVAGLIAGLPLFFYGRVLAGRSQPSKPPSGNPDLGS